MSEGRLKNGFNDKGFTFVADSEGGDVFLHVTHLASGEDKSLFIRGAHITYEVEMVTRRGEEKPQARDARIKIVADGQKPPIATGLHGTVKFWHATGYGFVIDANTGTEYYAHHAAVQRGYLDLGDRVTFDVEEGTPNVRACNVVVSSWGKVGDPFADELDLGNPNWVVPLAELAEKKEEWNYRVKPSKDKFIILRSYIKYTYLRHRELEGHLVRSADEQYLAFNTGLVTDFQEEIFAVFRRQSDGDKAPMWRLERFDRTSAESFLRLFGGVIPPLAWYYTRADELVYDTSIPLRVNVEHVPHDPERFPDSLKAFSPEDLAGLVNAKAPEAIERVKRNYKTAIPQFYRDSRNTGTGKMQLLLPVGLVRRDQVELALAVDRLESGVYLGRTVLTLDWAYNNARLLTRPDTDWLQP